MTNNYTWNRLWTFRGQRGHVAYQGLRFLVVSTLALAANLVVLHLLVAARARRRSLAQAIAIVLVTPLNFVGNKLWSFRTALASLVAASRSPRAALARAAPSAPVYDEARAPGPDAVPAAPPEPAADRGAGDRDPARATRRSPTGSTATRRPADRRRLSTGDRTSGR